jgi:serine/threonine-protein kinase
MKREEYEIVVRIFSQACDMAPHERASFLDGACAEHPHLRAEIEAMLAADRRHIEATVSMASDSSGDLELSAGHPASRTVGAKSTGETQRFAGYELVEEIGRGGMGVVYKARQLQPSRTVAIKMIRSGTFASMADIERFHTEVEATANLEHDGVVPIYEMGEHDGEHFFSMKFVEGQSLAKRLEAGDLPRRKALELLKAVCDAIAHAHEQGVVHRDVKPSNILLDGRGRPWVTDFGLAKYLDRDSTLTTAGDVMGTPGYMPPEQAAGQADSVTTASDVYSLGAILYQILTGRPPIQMDELDRANLLDALRQVQEADIAPPRSIDRRIPRDVETICMKCLEKDPAGRYPTAGELADDLGRYLEDEPILARPVSVFRKVLRWARRKPGLATTWAAIAVFYTYHLVCCYVLRLPDMTREFRLTSTAVVATWCVGAWYFQRRLDRSGGKPIYLFLWITMEVALVTVLLFPADGAKSALAILYHLLVAGAVLRLRTDLVGYATVLALVGYLSHVLYAAGYRPDALPPFREVVPFTISLGLIGLIQYFALRRCRSGWELMS